MTRGLRRLVPGACTGLLLAAAAWLMLTTLGGFSAVQGAERCGMASWYGGKHHGRRTASGEIFNQNALTAALPRRSEIGRVYRVTRGKRSVVVRITDLGPHKRLGRIIDLSRAAAAKLGMLEAGVAKVCIERIH